MSKYINELNQEWKSLRQELKDNRRQFDDGWRKRNENHNCDSKVTASNGEWFCGHLTKARNKHFKTKIQRIDNIVCSIISLIE